MPGAGVGAGVHADEGGAVFLPVSALTLVVAAATAGVTQVTPPVALDQAPKGRCGARQGRAGRQLGLESDLDDALAARWDRERGPVDVGRLVGGRHRGGLRPEPGLLLLDRGGASGLPTPAGSVRRMATFWGVAAAPVLRTLTCTLTASPSLAWR